jgi:hypothetical protein
MSRGSGRRSGGEGTSAGFEIALAEEQPTSVFVHLGPILAFAFWASIPLLLPIFRRRDEAGQDRIERAGEHSLDWGGWTLRAMEVWFGEGMDVGAEDDVGEEAGRGR